MKDNFSKQASNYAQFRPVYPESLFTYLFSLVPHRDCAWDCGTGNGQVAIVLANSFDRVYATDISAQQLAQAAPKPNLIYSLQPAEKTNFPANHFDLITVAQAVHWFDFGRFYSEVNRTVKPGGILALIGYGLIRSTGVADAIIRDFYTGRTHQYWDKERRYVDEEYRTVPFPFVEIAAPVFSIELQWSISQLSGYLRTWSAVQHYITQNGEDPVKEVEDQLSVICGEQAKLFFTFPVFLRLAAINK